ncbi:MAG: hypothetical protein IJG52_07600 [Lachnospiraceae bacterium]|nr:hypothetical protein [Lachnospiraceae bacterium]
MKKATALILTAAMLAGLVSGCGGSAPAQESESAPAQEKEESAAVQAKEEVTEEVKEEAPAAQSKETAQQGGNGMSVGTAGNGGDTVLENVSYVLIYNPKIFDETNADTRYLTSLGTGDFSGQIITGIARAGLDEDVAPYTMSQRQLTEGLDLEGVDVSGAKAGGMAPIHSLGEEYDFFCCDDSMNRILQTFTCVYEGEHCYVWSAGDAVTEEGAKRLGTEFDSVIYPSDTEAFGQGRFTENGGKVNILMYPMQGGLCGFFHLYDIFSSGEVPPGFARSRGFNLDHAIININSSMMDYNEKMVYATLAHEYQHQICASDKFGYSETPWMRTWLNEAMSAYAEELIYDDIMDAEYYNQLLYLSDSYRKGQSLYDFGVTSQDIGAYGAVCLFERYLSKNSDEKVFSNIHDFWRNSYRGDISEAQAIYNSVTDDFKAYINGITFPDSVKAELSGEEEQWMSKMTLDFYLTTMDMDLAHLVGAEDVARRYMLYTEINQQEIEGGGRMLVATENGSYAVPEDADKGLIYIGFDENFNTVTDLVTVE